MTQPQKSKENDWEWGDYAHPGKDWFEMKPNEWVLMITMLAVSIFCFAVGLVWQGIFWTTFLIYFGIWELVLKHRTDKTLSQHVWSKPLWVRIVLSVLMVAAFISLGYHFIAGAG
jgi:hypothetical protein